ncbi:MAG: hypothetical protein K2X03_10120 [Bryobacteraceae bacterium]|nr:hypothetical protein [Bryobacteraceae bacterium]
MRKQVWQTILLAAAAAATPLFGQCPANPLTALSGTWTFNVQHAQPTVPGRFLPLPGTEFMIAGQFTASLGSSPAGQIGVLTINATSDFLRSTTRQESDTGRYQINDNCTGGTLTMNLSSLPMQYDFVFTNGGKGLYLISTRQSRAATGSAFPGVNSCPAGVTPLSLLSGPYAFSFQSDGLSEVYGISGRMEARQGTNAAGQPIGLLDITASSVIGTLNLIGSTSVTRLERNTGRFQVNSDCTGGTLNLNLGSRPQQFEFYFRAGFQEVDVIGTSGRSISGTMNAASAVGCPVNPLSRLVGPWTYNAQSIFRTLNFTNRTASAGRFVASAGVDPVGNPRGVLNINATSLFATLLGIPTGATRLEDDLGRFQIFDDCTGGTLTMNLSSGPQQYDFWFYNNNQSIYMISTTQGSGVIGSATLGVAGCPAGLTDPLSLVSGLYSAKIQRIPDFTLEAYGLVGLLTATPGRNAAGNPIGQLGILATSTLGLDGSVARVESDRGSYQVEADCLGGTLTFNLSSRPAQYQFYFRSGFQAMDVISTAGPLAFGVVSRY